MARGKGADEIVLTAPADTQAVLPMVLSAGLRGRIRMAGDTLSRADLDQRAAGLSGVLLLLSDLSGAWLPSRQPPIGRSMASCGPHVPCG